MVAEFFFLTKNDMNNILEQAGLTLPHATFFAEGRKDGSTVPGIFQVEPLEEPFHWSSGPVDLERSEGYFGKGGAAGWGELFPPRRLAMAGEQPVQSLIFFSEIPRLLDPSQGNDSLCYSL